jgi:hypothetical protein
LAVRRTRHQQPEAVRIRSWASSTLTASCLALRGHASRHLEAATGAHHR